MPRYSASLPVSLSENASPDAEAALGAADVVHLKKALLKRRRYRRVFLDHPAAFDRLKPGLSDLPPGRRNDALTAWIASSERPTHFEPECIHAARVVARALCWLDLHR